jgi:hypothetical protein
VRSALCAFAALLVLAAGSAASAQELKLPITPTGPAPRDGRYMAGDDVAFLVDHAASGQVRFRYADRDEIFYLSSEPGAMGTRILKHDTGDVLMTVAGWGGVTVYTRGQPNGLPAERTGDAPELDPRPVAGADIKLFAARLSQRLAQRHNLAIGFSANWELLAREAPVRALAADSMRNATYALEDLAAMTELRAVIARRINAVRVMIGTGKGAALRNENGVQYLVITFVPQGGPSARPSSIAIARAVRESLRAAFAREE